MVIDMNHLHIRLGLCCIFRGQPIRFRRTTARYISRFSRPEQLQRISSLCLHNAQSLHKALRYCAAHGIGDFRINSQILPLYTHPVVGYTLRDLPNGADIKEGLQLCGHLCRSRDIRTSFHPDQFTLLSSPKQKVTENALAELDYQAMVAEFTGADVINIHGGGAYGNKPDALARLRRHLAYLPGRVRQRLTLENDDRVYPPEDLLPLCLEEGIPLVYDVHHHRCLPDRLSIAEATDKALHTWNREPLFHISSPKLGWQGKDPRQHHDYIDPMDFPECWLPHTLTVEVEAKAKELAVARLQQDLRLLAKRGTPHTLHSNCNGEVPS